MMEIDEALENLRRDIKEQQEAKEEAIDIEEQIEEGERAGVRREDQSF